MSSPASESGLTNQSSSDGGRGGAIRGSQSRSWMLKCLSHLDDSECVSDQKSDWVEAPPLARRHPDP